MYPLLWSACDGATSPGRSRDGARVTGCKKLRKQHCLAVQVLVFIRICPFRKDTQYSRSVVIPLRRPTSDTAAIVKAALLGIEHIFQPGFLDAKAGVMLLDFQPDTQMQTEFDLDDDDAGEDRTRLMHAMDTMNQRFGKGTVLTASTGLEGEPRQGSMKQECLVVSANRKRRYGSYLGEISPAPENLINRDFQADSPNEKWLTEITEFQIPAGKVYLSPMIDCFDGLVVSWTIGTRPDSDLVNTMLDAAIDTVATSASRPVIHSDRGAHYRWPGWLSRVREAKLIRSMSR